MIRRVLVLSLCALLGACAAHRPENLGTLPPAPPQGEPTDMLGLSADALKLAYGPPAFARLDGPTQMWRYDGAACRAFFFLYPQKGILQVGHVETVPHRADTAADASCLAALRQQPPAPKPAS